MVCAMLRLLASLSVCLFTPDMQLRSKQLQESIGPPKPLTQTILLTTQVRDGTG